ncbi:exo-alpha-sialidase [Rhodococcus hoagii]|nr:exo-alpha-sialidase [Prescottella equi]NKR58475.1 exo-alpha-sialidase [Prescottella equi]NKR68746.1 exo-alpha-sialidase [Prescottella equi]NKS66883.1 exo-alpha-sialidase [Prescottella equi]NKS76320.1 exo-alpha-sialidase [Prescottella equi]
MARFRTAALPLIVAAALAVAGCTTDTKTTADAESTTPPAPNPRLTTMPLSPELDHLHGLHVDADGTVLAGTHSGLLALAPSGNTTRVGTSDDDLMGLSGVPGTDTLFSSGHPGPSSDAPDPLGLARSTDGGVTWESRSLVGEVDFHALASDGNVLAGFDTSSGIRVSADDGATWADGAAIGVSALAVTEAGIWAATPDGLLLSTDGARTFAPTPGAPRLGLVSAGTDGALWGMDVDGNAWRSRDGRAWEEFTRVGDVEALTALDYDTAYAATAQELHTLR